MVENWCVHGGESGFSCCGGVLELFYGRVSLVVLLYFSNSFVMVLLKQLSIFEENIISTENIPFSVRLVFVAAFLFAVLLLGF